MKLNVPLPWELPSGQQCWHVDEVVLTYCIVEMIFPVMNFWADEKFRIVINLLIFELNCSISQKVVLCEVTPFCKSAHI